MEQKYYPHIIVKASYCNETKTPNRRSLNTSFYPTAIYLGDNAPVIKDCLQYPAYDNYGIQIDVHPDTHVQDISKRGAYITLKDTTPDKSLKIKNNVVRIEPGEYKAFRFDIGNNTYIQIKFGLYMIAEEHCIPHPGETFEQMQERNQKEFIPYFCSMKQLIDEYEYLTPYKKLLFKDKLSPEKLKTINFYEKYYKQVNVRGLGSDVEKDNFLEM